MLSAAAGLGPAGQRSPDGAQPVRPRRLAPRGLDGRGPEPPGSGRDEGSRSRVWFFVLFFGEGAPLPECLDPLKKWGGMELVMVGGTFGWVGFFVFCNSCRAFNTRAHQPPNAGQYPTFRDRTPHSTIHTPSQAHNYASVLCETRPSFWGFLVNRFSFSFSFFPQRIK